MIDLFFSAGQNDFELHFKRVVFFYFVSEYQISVVIFNNLMNQISANSCISTIAGILPVTDIVIERKLFWKCSTVVFILHNQFFFILRLHYSEINPVFFPVFKTVIFGIFYQIA